MKEMVLCFGIAEPLAVEDCVLFGALESTRAVAVSEGTALKLPSDPEHVASQKAEGAGLLWLE